MHTIIIMISSSDVAERAPEILQSAKYGLKAIVFLDFFIFLPYLMIFQSSTLKNHQIWQKFGKKMKKNLFRLSSTHFTMVSVGT